MDDDDYSKTCGPVMDRRNPVNLDELFVPLAVKSKECDNLLAVAEEDGSGDDDDDDKSVAAEPSAATAAAKASSSALVNDINARFSNDHTQTVGPYLDMADPSRKVSVRDLFKPLDSKSKEMQNLAEESEDDGEGDGRPTENGTEHYSEPPQQTQTCGPVIIDSGPIDDSSGQQNLERIFDQSLDQGNADQQQQASSQEPTTEQSQQQDGADADNVTAIESTSPQDDGGPKRPPPNLDHGILTTKDGTPLIRLRSKKSIMESRFKLTMRTWDDVWKSTAWAKFAPDKLKHTLQRSARNQGELKGTADETNAAAPSVGPPEAIQVKKSRFRVVPHVQIDDQPTKSKTADKSRSSPKPPLSSSSGGSSDTDSDRLPAGLPMIESNLNELTMVESELKKLEREHVAKHQLLTPKNDNGSTEKTTLTADDGGAASHKQQQRGDGKKRQNDLSQSEF